MIVNESAENYLETILVLSKQLPVVRSVDVANELGFKKSSVSVAMKNLREKNHITVTKAGFIYLTDSGRAIAEMIYERHQLISSCLMKLGVSEKTAVEDACRIEHVISKESFDALKNHIKKCKKNSEENETNPILDLSLSFYTVLFCLPFLTSLSVHAWSSGSQ